MKIYILSRHCSQWFKMLTYCDVIDTIAGRQQLWHHNDRLFPRGFYGHSLSVQWCWELVKDTSVPSFSESVELWNGWQVTSWLTGGIPWNVVIKLVKGKSFSYHKGVEVSLWNTHLCPVFKFNFVMEPWIVWQATSWFTGEGQRAQGCMRTISDSWYNASDELQCMHGFGTELIRSLAIWLAVSQDYHLFICKVY